MMSKGRVAAIAIVAVGVGFVGGVWFIGSGAGFGLIPMPKVEPANFGALAPPPPPRPRAKAVGLPAPVTHFSRSSAGLIRATDRADLLPTPGCQWEIDPSLFRLGHSWHSTDSLRTLGGYSSVDPETGGLRFLLIHSARRGAPTIELRPVFFDAEAHRILPEFGGGNPPKGGDGVFAMTEFRLDPGRHLSPDKVAYFGLERVTPASAGRMIAAAQREAKEKGVPILPPVRLGEAYPFDLVDSDGKTLRAEDFRGKVVAVVVWAPGGFNSAALGALKQVREFNPKDQLAVIGVSFDGSAEDARDAFALSGAKAPIVVVPNELTARRIWREGVGIDQFPMVLLIDREGVLRFNCSQFDLKDRVDALFGRPNPRSRFLQNAMRFDRFRPKAATVGPPKPSSTPQPKP